MLDAVKPLSHDIGYSVNGRQTVPGTTRKTYSNTAYIGTEIIGDRNWLVFLAESRENDVVPLFRVRVPLDTSEASGGIVTSEGELVGRAFSPKGYSMPIFEFSQPWGGRYDFIKRAKAALEGSNHPRRDAILARL